MNWITLTSFVIWLYVLTVLKRANLEFWHFLIGSAGLFAFFMIFIQPMVTEVLVKAVTIVTGRIGEQLHMFEGYYEYAILFVKNKKGAISILVDYECAGSIEMAAFFSLLFFFPVYITMEKLLVALFGLLYLFFANVIRMSVICMIISGFGNDSYFFAHTIVGRVIFYGLSMLLYYMVFTKAQVIRQKVGNIQYGNT
ncbi:exosortase family protein XrtG [Anaerosporobacter faecicola]|uniref:exosortase family protein XrtG n=1 Tax=Anaerosporobacter faecicola TaxID=2718714 RepID=UPI00143A86BA|nr:exosortase family protein XrtG [Anaerosporobacter faecicola]